MGKGDTGHNSLYESGGEIEFNHHVLKKIPIQSIVCLTEVHFEEAAGHTTSPSIVLNYILAKEDIVENVAPSTKEDTVS